MKRSILANSLVIVGGLILAIVVFVLLITGVFTLSNDLVFYISLFEVGILNLLALESGFLLSHHHLESRWAVRSYLQLALVGTVGILVDLLLAVLLSAAQPVALMVFIATDFFFLSLLLGGDALLILELARWRIGYDC